jgi:cell division protein ZapA (FtsZ GTPase activity inhibitor)
MELMGETELMQRMFPLPLPLQVLQGHKVNVARKVLMELQDLAVQPVQLVLQDRAVLLDLQVQQGLQEVVQQVRKVRQVLMERMEPMASQVAPVQLAHEVKREQLGLLKLRLGRLLFQIYLEQWVRVVPHL